MTSCIWIVLAHRDCWWTMQCMETAPPPVSFILAHSIDAIPCLSSPAPFAVAPHSFFYCSPISLIPSLPQKCLCPSPSLSGSSCQAAKIVINSSQKGQQLCGVCDICAIVTRNQVKFKSTNLVSQLIFKVTRRVLDSQNHCISGQTLVVEILYIISVIDEALLCEIAV